MAMPEIEIVAGSYEELLLGYRLIEENGVFTLEQSFTDHSHTGCIKTVAISRRGVLASGGTDEIVRLINLKKRTELGSLMEHEGAVTCVQFHGGSHLFTTSEDKKICIWKSFTWECLRTLRGHKGGVNHVAIHPSGKLALSVGRDNCMQTWNLVRGRSAYITNTKQAGDLVVWSTLGDSYIIVINNSMDIYSTETASIQCSVKAAGRINSVVFLENEVIAYAGEGGDIIFHHIKENKQLSCLKTNTVRVRGLVCTPSPYNADKLLIVAVSSDGMIKVWEVKADKEQVESQLLTEHNTKFRLTCVAITPTRADKSRQTSDAQKKTPSEAATGDKSDGSNSEADSAPGNASEKADITQTEASPAKWKRKLQPGREETTKQSPLKKKTKKKRKGGHRKLP